MIAIAIAILKAHQIHEESWDGKDRRYRLTLVQAAKKATSDEDIASLVSMVLYAMPNDVIYWAGRVLGDE